ncbi:MAG: hypothetical protein NVS9B12_05610 [Vulcanimicrobiaceae bacterium]
MKISSLLSAALAICALSIHTPGMARSMAHEVATIVNSGSTNSSGFTLKVYASGKAVVSM